MLIFSKASYSSASCAFFPNIMEKLCYEPYNNGMIQANASHGLRLNIMITITINKTIVFTISGELMSSKFFNLLHILVLQSCNALQLNFRLNHPKGSSLICSDNRTRIP